MRVDLCFAELNTEFLRAFGTLEISKQHSYSRSAFSVAPCMHQSCFAWLQVCFAALALLRRACLLTSFADARHRFASRALTRAVLRFAELNTEFLRAFGTLEISKQHSYSRSAFGVAPYSCCFAPLKLLHTVACKHAPWQ